MYASGVLGVRRPLGWHLMFAIVFDGVLDVAPFFSVYLTFAPLYTCRTRVPDPRLCHAGST